MKTSPYFPFYPADFIVGTMMLSAEEVGAYIRLLAFQWQQGGIPSAPGEQAIIAGVRAGKLAKVLTKFEMGADGFLRNTRLEAERVKVEDARSRNAENGKKGGRPKTKTDSQPKDNPPVIFGLSQSEPKKSQSETESESETKPESNTPVVPKGTEVGAVYSEAFEEFWQLYPRKEGKGQAWKVWERIKGRPGVDVLRSSIELHKATEQWQRDGGQYIPHPSTWLNGRRWEDSPQGPQHGGLDLGYRGK
jgi:uncharacterized protein YdaU (DUF1376 family)